MDPRPRPSPPTGPRQRSPRRDESGAILIARPFGVPVYLAPSWFLVAALITYVFAENVEEAVPDLGPWRYAVSLTFALLLYLSVLVHELSHTVVALQAGLPVRRISLYLLGGVSEIEKPAQTPGREAGIAAAGPAVSLVIGAVAYGVFEVLDEGTVGRLLAGALMWSNLVVGGFNMLPGLPLDGGRVLAAAVWRASGQRHHGVVVAAWVGRGVAIVVLLLPSLVARLADRTPDVIDLVWGALLGSFIWMGASQSLRAAQIQRTVPSLSARTLTRRAIPVAAGVPLAEALRQSQEAGARAMVVVGGDGKPVGIVNEEAVRATPEQRRPWVPVGDFARRLQPEMVVSADATGEDLVDAITRLPSAEYLVVEANGDVYGVLSAVDVERAVAQV